MATEVESESYTHGSNELSTTNRFADETGEETLQRLASKGAGFARPAAGGPRPSRPRPRDMEAMLRAERERAVFRHNPLHDFESMFWVATWILVCSDFLKEGKVPSEMSEEEWKKCILHHAEFGRILFGSHNRRFALMASAQSTEFLDRAQSLLDPIWDVFYDLENFRKELLREYDTVSNQRRDAKEVPFSEMASNKLYASLTALFNDDAEELRRDGKDLTINIHTRDEKRLKIQESVAQAPELEDGEDGDGHRDKRSRTSTTGSSFTTRASPAGPSAGTRSRTPRDRSGGQ